MVDDKNTNASVYDDCLDFQEYNISMSGNSLPRDIGIVAIFFLALFYSIILMFIVAPLSMALVVLDGWLLSDYIETGEIVSSFTEWLIQDWQARFTTSLGLSVVSIDLLITTFLLYFIRQRHYLIITLSLLIYGVTYSIVVGLPLFIFTYNGINVDGMSMAVLMEQVLQLSSYNFENIIQNYFQYYLFTFSNFFRILIVIPITVFVLQLYTAIYLKVGS